MSESAALELFKLVFEKYGFTGFVGIAGLGAIAFLGWRIFRILERQADYWPKVVEANAKAIDANTKATYDLREEMARKMREIEERREQHHRDHVTGIQDMVRTLERGSRDR